MNRIYKSIWNAVTRSWTAVSEITKTHSKTIKSSLFFVTLITCVNSAFAAHMYNTDTYVTEDIGEIQDIVVIRDAIVEYKEGVDIRPVATQLQQFQEETGTPGRTQLTVTGIDQLGDSVTFYTVVPDIGNFESYSQLIINKNNTDSNWNFGDVQFETFNSGAGAGHFSQDSIVVARGQGQENERFVITNKDNWSKFYGWLRISNTNFDLNLDQQGTSIFDHVGLSVGQNGTVYATERYMNIDRFGWSGQDAGNGILDLTRVNPDDTLASSDKPFIHVNRLWMEGDGYIKLDLSQYLTPGSVMFQDSVLDYQEGNRENRFWVLTADEINGSRKVEIIDASGQIISTDLNNPSKVEEVELFNLTHTDKLAAKGDWGYVAYYNTDNSEDTLGVYVDYRLLSLSLAGGDDKEASLMLVLDDGTKRDLSIPVSGYGIIDIDTSATNNKRLVISNIDNSFDGLVNVGAGSELEVLSGSLGEGNTNIGTSVVLQDNASLHLTESYNGVTSNESQTINGFRLGSNSFINLNGNTELVLNLGGDQIYLEDNDSNNKIGDKQLRGSGNLTLNQGELTFMSSSTLFHDEDSGYHGNLAVNGTANMIFSDQNTDAEFVLQKLSGNGKATLDTNTTVGDIQNFEGSLSVNDSKEITFSSDSKLNTNKKIQVTGGNDSLAIFNQFSTDPSTVINKYIEFNNLNNIQFDQTNGTFVADQKLNLTLNNSNIIRTASTSLNTIDAAIISSGSILSYSNFNGDPVDLSSVSGEGVLDLDFANSGTLSVNAINSDNSFTLRFENAQFEVGLNNDTNQNNSVKNIFVGENSTLILNGKKIMQGELTLTNNSTLDFTTDNGFNPSGESINVLDMNNNRINLTDSANDIITVNVNPSTGIKLPGTDQSLMNIVRDENTQGTDLILINNIKINGKDELATIAGALTPKGNLGSEATITYGQANSPIADITIGVDTHYGLNSDNSGHIGLNYSKVKKVAIYDGKVAEFEATGTDTISAQITDQAVGAKGSVHYFGNGDVLLTGSDNSYSGETLVDGGVRLTANSGTLGKTQSLTIGSADVSGDLTITGSQHSDGFDLSIESGSSLIVKGDSYTTEVTAKTLNGSGELTLSDNSKLIYTNDNDAILSLDVKTENNAVFEKSGLGTLDFGKSLNGINLSLINGTVVLRDKDNIGSLNFGSSVSRSASTSTVIVPGLVSINKLSGNNGVFNLTNVAFGEGQNDFVEGKSGLDIIEGTGQHKLAISMNSAQASEEKIKVAEVEKGSAEFSLTNGSNAITVGAYNYTLEKSSNGNNGTNYYLSSIVEEDITEPDKDTESSSAERKIAVEAGSYIGIAYAAQLFDVSLHDRVGNRDWINPVTGEKQSTSLWMRHSMSHERFRDSTSQLRMRSTSNVTMLGGDLVQYTTDGDGFAYAGLMGGYGTMDTKTRSKVTDLRSKAETDAWGVGAYAGWKANKDGQTGPYVDGWLMFTHASSDVTGVDRQEENIKGEGLSASIEAGWGFKLGSVETTNGKYATFTLEPHASVTWFGMEYDDLHTDAQDVKFEGKNNVRTRLGTRVNMTEEGNKTFNAFAEANWVHNTQEYGATISGLTVDQTGSRNQAEGRIGVDWRITKDLSAWARVGASFGSDNYSEREGSIGVRYQF